MLLADTNMFSGFYDLSNQFLSIILTTIVICVISIIYNKKIRNHKVDEKLTGFLVLMEMFIMWVEDLITGIMGKKYRKLTPYGMYIILYIVVSSVISLIGVEPLTSSYTVTFCMGFATFIGIYYFGLRYQKLRFFKKFLNPLELITQFVPLISISFRLFGNILGGSIILGLLYSFLIGLQGTWGGAHSMFTPGDGNDMTYGWINNDIFNSIDGKLDETWTQQYKYFWTGINPLAILIMPFLHMYFDLFDGAIQSIVFAMLTMAYWEESIGEHGEENEPHKMHGKNNLKENKNLKLKNLKAKNKDTLLTA
ncbi:F0F1 ATP synthase subunit A [Spiroplasma endosymbiont of Labia minor]|uniref:F0F1 ATP synthase subunit A n=1 Tax=Spiroplasma endosymbiont of Labia minor TaxID=3066305 RepID=UPI0030D1752A